MTREIILVFQIYVSTRVKYITRETNGTMDVTSLVSVKKDKVDCINAKLSKWNVIDTYTCLVDLFTYY